MKDRYQNFIESQQDPYEDDEYEEDDEEEYEYDEEDEDEDDEDGDEDEEEEDVPAAKNESSPKPFGNGLNIQLGGLRADNGGSNGKPVQNVKQGGQPGFTPKQVKPVSAVPQEKMQAQAFRPASAAPQQKTQDQPVRPVQTVQAKVSEPVKPAAFVKPQPKPVETEPIDFSPVEEDFSETGKKHSWKERFSGKFKKRDGADSEIENDSDSEELDEAKPRGFGKLASLMRRKAKEPEDIVEDEIEDEEPGEVKPRGFGKLASLMKRKARDVEDTIEDEIEDDGFDEVKSRGFGKLASLMRRKTKDLEEDGDETGEEAVRGRLGKKITRVSSRIRNRFSRKETLDEFKEDLEAPAEEISRKWGKGKIAGMIGGSAVALLAAGYTGYTYLNQREKGTDNNAAAASDLESSEKSYDAFANLKSASEMESEPAETLDDPLESVDSASLADDDFLAAETSADDTHEVEGVGEASEGSADILADDAFDTVPESAPETETASESAESGADPLDFDFGDSSVADTSEPKAEIAEESDGEFSDSLSVSATRPPYGDENTGRPVADTLEQFSSDMADAGEKIKSGFQSGLERADASLSEAGRKTQEFLNETGQKIGGAMEQTRDNIAETFHDANDQAHDAAQRVGDSLQNARDRAGESIQNFNDQAREKAQQVGSSLQDARDRAGESIQNFNEQVSGTLQDAGDQARDAAQRVGSSLSDARDQLNETGRQLGESAARMEQNVESSLQGAGSSLRGSRNEPLQVSLGDRNGRESSLSLTPANRGDAGSSLGGNAVSDYEPNQPNTGIDSFSRQTPAGSSLSPARSDSSLSADSALQPSSGDSSLSAGAAPVSDAVSSAEGAFNAESDLSNMGEFDMPEAEENRSFSTALSPFGNDYARPEETVPKLSADAVSNSPDLNTNGYRSMDNGYTNVRSELDNSQLSSLDYNPADSGSSARYNSQNHAVGQLSSSLGNYREYRTKAGDNLITIAENELGDATRWAEISKMNPGMNLRGRLQEGLLIRIPTGGN